MIHKYDSEYEHDLINGRYCIECGCELNGDMPMHVRFCTECAEVCEEKMCIDFIADRPGDEFKLLQMSFNFGEY